MKRYPICRILFFLVTVAAFAAACYHFGVTDKIGTNRVAHVAIGGMNPNALPVAGQSFPVAGQEEEPSKESGIILRAQDEAEVGELVRFDASDSDVDGLTWQIIPYTEDFEVIEDGRRAFFSSRVGGRYLVIIAAAKDQKPFLQHHTIEVIGGEIAPGPENLAARVRRWAKKVDDYEGREAHALALAGVFRKLATADEVTVDGMLEATATANSAVLGDNLENWLPLLEPLGTELDVITEAGKLKTREDYKDVWLKIADGLEKAA